MTRKARRKTLTESPQSAPWQQVSPWLTVGALVATTALGGARPALAAAVNLPAAATGVDLRADPRLSLIHEVLQGVSRIKLRAIRRTAADVVQERAAAQESRRFDIPSAPLSSVIPAFEAATGLTVVPSSPSLGAITSPGVAGTMTVEHALAAITAGTGVTFRFTAANTVSLELRIDVQSVEVTGRVPTAVVSSPKYVAPLREVPQTIEVIPRAVFEQQGATTLSEVLRNVPGISIQAGEGGGASSTSGDMFNMHGFNARNSLFVDGVRDDGLIARDVFNLEQVEVFLGAAGSDVGRGNAAATSTCRRRSRRSIPHLPPTTDLPPASRDG